jgi:hypothetical protein
MPRTCLRPMIRVLHHALIALLLTSAASAARAARPSAELVLAGVVSDGAGRPVPGAHVVVLAERRTSVVTGHDGGFRVRTVLPTVDHLRAAPCTVQVFVTAHKLRMVLPRGDASLTMALSVESSPERGERAIVRANDERVAAIAAGLLAAGSGVATADSVRFLALDGERVGDPPFAKMPHVAQIALATTIPEPLAAVRETVQTPPGPAPQHAVSPMPAGLDLASRPAAPVDHAPSATHAAPATAKAAASPSPAPAHKAATPAATPSAKAPASAAGKATASAADPAPKTTSAPAGGAKPSASKSAAKAVAPVKVIVNDGAPGAGPAAPPAAGSCTCRIKGTVELMMDPPPTEPVGVAIWAEDYPALRDSVVIALGPPRPFELVGLPCGGHHLLVRSSSRHSYVIAEPRDMTLPCSAGLLLQPRIVLRPR